MTRKPDRSDDPLGLDETHEVLARLDGINNLILVGGQAVSFWGDYFANKDDYLKTHGPITSCDVDFLAGRSEVFDAEQRLGAKAAIPTMDDHTPNTGLIHFKNAAGKDIRIDFLGSVHGVSHRDVIKTAVTVEWHGLRLSVMHPLLCLQSRLANLAFPNYRNNHSFGQLEACVHIVNQQIAAELKQDNQRTALNIAEVVADLAIEDTAKEVYLERGIDVLRAIPYELFPSRDFKEKRWPQIVERTQDARGKYAKVRKARSSTRPHPGSTDA